MSCTHSETLSSFWKKLEVGTGIRVTVLAKGKTIVCTGKIVKKQTNSAARDGNSRSGKTYTKEAPCWFYKPKASECDMEYNKIHSYSGGERIIYEILEA